MTVIIKCKAHVELLIRSNVHLCEVYFFSDFNLQHFVLNMSTQ